jgi:hypothetical protein
VGCFSLQLNFRLAGILILQPWLQFCPLSTRFLMLPAYTVRPIRHLYVKNILSVVLRPRTWVLRGWIAVGQRQKEFFRLQGNLSANLSSFTLAGSKLIHLLISYLPTILYNGRATCVCNSIEPEGRSVALEVEFSTASKSESAFRSLTLASFDLTFSWMKPCFTTIVRTTTAVVL